MSLIRYLIKQENLPNLLERCLSGRKERFAKPSYGLNRTGGSIPPLSAMIFHSLASKSKKQQTFIYAVLPALTTQTWHKTGNLYLRLVILIFWIKITVKHKDFMRIRILPNIFHDKVVREYKTGVSICQLAEKYKVPTIEIHRILKKKGIVQLQ